MKAYSLRYRNSVVQKLNSPGGPTAKELSARLGIPRGTLYRWRIEARVSGVPQDHGDDDNAALPLPREARRPEDWPAEDKLRVVREAAQLEGADLGAFLRREGLHEADLKRWREKIEEAALSALSGTQQRSQDRKRIRQLERDIERKDKALAEGAALLLLSKKARALWGDDEGNGTTGSGGE